MASTSLRDLVADRVEGRWTQWAQAHPNLAQVIDRTRLVESAVERLAEDPAFQQAMRDADLDEAKLAAALKVVQMAERWIGRVMAL